MSVLRYYIDSLLLSLIICTISIFAFGIFDPNYIPYVLILELANLVIFLVLVEIEIRAVKKEIKKDEQKI